MTYTKSIKPYGKLVAENGWGGQYFTVDNKRFALHQQNSVWIDGQEVRLFAKRVDDHDHDHGREYPISYWQYQVIYKDEIKDLHELSKAVDVFVYP
ncbi:hypothetical protein IM753_03150 [Moraxella sp. K127]|uniref:hypothetical protein n=1 Tax=Moraxella sp. K127 TaxID=2780079 RepID=UPI0018808430|nr:hypothetical protein [Moraxella sp. K127]MBE9589988.1 hypothetical protein [Moraxella sp. K127]